MSPHDDLGRLLMHATRALRTRWHEAVEPWGISPHQYRALAVVEREESPRLGQIADELRINPRSATEVVDGLAAQDLVVRVPDAADRRAVCVQLTDRGREVAREAKAAREVRASEFFSVLSDTDATELARLLRLLDREA